MKHCTVISVKRHSLFRIGPRHVYLRLTEGESARLVRRGLVVGRSYPRSGYPVASVCIGLDRRMRQVGWPYDSLVRPLDEHAEAHLTHGHRRMVERLRDWIEILASYTKADWDAAAGAAQIPVGELLEMSRSEE